MVTASLMRATAARTRRPPKPLFPVILPLFGRFARLDTKPSPL